MSNEPERDFGAAVKTTSFPKDIIIVATFLILGDREDFVADS